MNKTLMEGRPVELWSVEETVLCSDCGYPVKFWVKELKPGIFDEWWPWCGECSIGG